VTHPAEKLYYTPDEYLAREDAAEYKSEYYRGQIFAMAGTAVNHNRITGNLYIKFNQAFAGKNCEAFMSEVKAWSEAEQFFCYPDLLIICGNPAFYHKRNDIITNPLIVIEVLSDSTRDFDRGNKFNFYRSIPTLREYILIDQYRIHVEQYSLNENGEWMTAEYRAADDILQFSSVDFQIKISELYERVK